MGKKKKQEIDLSNIKTVRLEINFSVPKEQFDELLRKMAHIAEGKHRIKSKMRKIKTRRKRRRSNSL